MQFSRVEDLAGVVVVAIILFSAIFAGYESINRLFHPQTVENLWAVIVASAVGFLSNEAVAHFRIKVGKENGSAGGHNGLKSIIASIGSEDFPRIRIGIGRPSQEHISRMDDAVVDHVLGDFLPDEQDAIKVAITRAAEAIECVLSEGIAAVMNTFN